MKFSETKSIESWNSDAMKHLLTKISQIFHFTMVLIPDLFLRKTSPSHLSSLPIHGIALKYEQTNMKVKFIEEHTHT